MTRQTNGTNVHPSDRRGFTLIETAITIVIVGMAVMAIMAAQQAYHRQNEGAAEMSTAMALANEMRELSLELSLRDPIYGTYQFGPESDEKAASPQDAVLIFDDLDDFAGSIGMSGEYTGTTLNPPVSALRQVIPNMDRWTQWVTAENVAADDISGAGVTPHSTDMVRMTVSIRYQRDANDEPREVTRLTWVSAGIQ